MAQSSLEFAQKSRLLWIGFQCSFYAETVGKLEERQRLFELSYRSGREFLDALEAGKINEAELQTTVPIGVQFLLGGPSKDFMLGRIYESSVGTAIDEVYLAIDGRQPDDELTRSRAMNEYEKANCELLR